MKESEFRILVEKKWCNRISRKSHTYCCLKQNWLLVDLKFRQFLNLNYEIKNKINEIRLANSQFFHNYHLNSGNFH